MYITDLEGSPTWAPGGDTVYIDYNGTDGPNVIGQDQVGVNFWWMNQTVAGQPRRPGQVLCADLQVEPYNTNNAVLCKQVLTR